MTASSAEPVPGRWDIGIAALLRGFDDRARWLDKTKGLGMIGQEEVFDR